MTEEASTTSDVTATPAATGDGPVAPVAVFKKRGAKGKTNFRKRAATPPPAKNSDSDSDDSGCTSSEDESGHRVKRRKRNTAAVTASSRGNKSSSAREANGATVFTADRSVPITSTNDATKQTNWYDEGSTTGSKAGANGSLASGAGAYRGLANKTTFIQKNPNAPDRKVGPIKAATNIRTVTTTDFAPDVCKDYKQTGFCGFGDNCKYLHDRTVVEQGWQLDRKWEEVTKGKKNMAGTVVASANSRGASAVNGKGGGGDDDDADAADEAMLEKIPFACVICKGPYREPIVTRCGHYFCLPCALQRYRKDPGCAACGSGTGGVFNTAKTLNKLLARKKERQARKKQKAIEAGEEVSDEEDEGARS